MSMKHNSNISVWTDMPETQNEVLQRLMDSPILYESYRSLNPE